MEKKDWVKKLDYQMLLNDKTEEKIWLNKHLRKIKSYKGK